MALWTDPQHLARIRNIWHAQLPSWRRPVAAQLLSTSSNRETFDLPALRNARLVTSEIKTKEQRFVNGETQVSPEILRIQKTQKLWQKCAERVLISLKFRFRLILISFTFPFSLWVLRLILNLKKIFNTSSKTEIVCSFFSMRDLCFLKHEQLFSLA